MKEIKSEDKIALQNLKQRISRIREQLTILLQANRFALTPRIGAAFFSENALISKYKHAFKEKNKFQGKLEILRNFSIELSCLAPAFLDLGTRLTQQDSKLKNEGIEALNKDFETSARKYYSGLLTLNEFLAELIHNRLGKTSLVKSPDIKNDIEIIEQQIKHLETQFEHFSSYLEAVSIKIIENTLQRKNSQGSIQQADIINLKTAIDHLEEKYINAYDSAFGKNGFWRDIKDRLKKSDRATELLFLKQLSDLPEANDSIRYQALTLVHNKIIETEVFGDTSHLKNILFKLINRGFRGFKTEENDLYAFLDKHDEIQMPGGLKAYYEKNKGEYHFDAVAIKTA